MAVFLLLGSSLEKVIGSVRYVILYTGAGICRKYHFCSILQYDRARCVVGRSFWCDIWISRCSCSNIFILQRTTTEIRWIWNLSNDRRKSVSWIQSGTTDNAAHIGGCIAGFILSMLLYVLGSLIAAHKQGRSV